MVTLATQCARPISSYSTYMPLLSLQELPPRFVVRFQAPGGGVKTPASSADLKLSACDELTSLLWMRVLGGEFDTARVRVPA